MYTKLNKKGAFVVLTLGRLYKFVHSLVSQLLFHQNNLNHMTIIAIDP